MAKKRSWFHFLKRLCVTEANSKPEQEKRKRWFFGRFKFKRLPPRLAPPSPPKERTLSQAEEDHSKHALTVAIATAAAAEAAVAAAQAAAEIVRLTGAPQSYLRTKSRRRDSAAIKIQTAFRGYLARKALRALKGLVRLQAMVRGRAVRRQAITSLKGLQSLVKIQSQVRARRVKMAEDSRIDADKEHLLRQNKELMELNTRRSSEDPQSAEGCSAILVSRQESLIRRKQAKQYLLNHQEKKLDSVFSSFSSYREIEGRSEHKMREFSEEEQSTGLSYSISLPRRSFHQPKRCSISENDTYSSSSSIPNYMSPTESAKAKARSISMPKQRLGYSDSYSDLGSSPSKNRLSFSSASSDLKTFKPPNFQQISPRLKSLSVPIKSRRTWKDLSINSECSLLNLDHEIIFK